MSYYDKEYMHIVSDVKDSMQSVSDYVKEYVHAVSECMHALSYDRKESMQTMSDDGESEHVCSE